MGPHRVAMTTDGDPDALQPGPGLRHPRLLLGVQPCEDPTPWTGIAWTDVTQPRSASAGDAAAKDDKVDGVGDGKPGPAAEAAPAEKGETLSSDSDDDDALHGAQGVDVSTGNLILAQFDKVSHSKNKWKCSLKGGVMTLNDKDVLFGKANGEFTW